MTPGSVDRQPGWDNTWGELPVLCILRIIILLCINTDCIIVSSGAVTVTVVTVSMGQIFFPAPPLPTQRRLKCLPPDLPSASRIALSLNALETVKSYSYCYSYCSKGRSQPVLYQSYTVSLSAAHYQPHTNYQPHTISRTLSVARNTQ